MRYFLILAFLSAAVPVAAQEAAPVQAAPAAPSESRPLFPHDERMANARGRGAAQIALGAVFIPIGLIIAGASAALWTDTNFKVFDSNCYHCDTSSAAGEVSVAVLLDIVGLGLVGAGTALLARGEADYHANKPAPLLVPILRASATGGLAGVQARF
jgi:hypothetical protein